MLILYLASILISVISLVFITFIFKKLGIVDRPDGVRKIHKGEIALGGGVSLFLTSIIFFWLFPQSVHDVLEINSALGFVWLISIIILLLGLWDDVKPLPFSARLIIQIFASWLVIVSTDIYIKDFGNLFGYGNLYIGQLGLPLTIFMVVGVCNAFNMLDGMDGLVGFVLLITSTTIAIIAWLAGLSGSLFLGTTVVSTFLLFNLGLFSKKWKIFLGDSGAMWIGFIIAWLLVIMSQQPKALFPPVTALWLILLPLIDALSTFMSRLLNKKSMFLGDRTHIHHLLLDSGLEKWKVLLICISISITSCLFAIYFSVQNTDESLQFYAFLTIWFCYVLLIKFPETRNKI